MRNDGSAEIVKISNTHANAAHFAVRTVRTPPPLTKRSYSIYVRHEILGDSEKIPQRENNDIYAAK